jgi:hypothetical protein
MKKGEEVNQLRFIRFKEVIDETCRAHLKKDSTMKTCIKISCEDCEYNSELAKKLVEVS